MTPPFASFDLPHYVDVTLCHSIGLTMSLTMFLTLPYCPLALSPPAIGGLGQLQCLGDKVGSLAPVTLELCFCFRQHQNQIPIPFS